MRLRCVRSRDVVAQEVAHFELDAYVARCRQPNLFASRKGGTIAEVNLLVCRLNPVPSPTGRVASGRPSREVTGEVITRGAALPLHP
jgi:hypothetical protein